MSRYLSRCSTSLKSGISICGLFVLCLLFILPAHAQKKKKNLPAEAKVEVPNGVWIDTLRLFADMTEIANIHYLEYCKWVGENEPEKYTACLPDTTVWFDIDEYADSYVANYFSYSGFKFFPVMGITKQQAENYAQWRSKIVTEAYNKKNKGLAKDYVIEIIYRLPTEKEWVIFASYPPKKVYDFKFFKENGYIKMTKRQKKEIENKFKNEYVNCKTPYDSIRYEKQLEKYGIRHNKYYRIGLYRISEYIFEYYPNQYNLYNTIGNVAEMVQEEGIAKGGSWFHTLEESAIKERQTYTKPTAWLGFRCVATVKLTPKKK